MRVQAFLGQAPKRPTFRAPWPLDTTTPAWEEPNLLQTRTARAQTLNPYRSLIENLKGKLRNPKKRTPKPTSALNSPARLLRNAALHCYEQDGCMIPNEQSLQFATLRCGAAVRRAVLLAAPRTSKQPTPSSRSVDGVQDPAACPARGVTHHGAEATSLQTPTRRINIGVRIISILYFQRIGHSNSSGPIASQNAQPRALKPL